MRIVKRVNFEATKHLKRQKADFAICILVNVKKAVGLIELVPMNEDCLDFARDMIMEIGEEKIMEAFHKIREEKLENKP